MLAVTGFVIAVLAGARGTWSPCGLSMVSAINPIAERSRGYRYWLTAVWFVAGAVVGSLAIAVTAVALAIALGAAGSGLSTPVAAALGAGLAVLTLASDGRVAAFQLPTHPRQVNELWLMRYRRWLYASGFGVQIGSGFATYIMTAANYLVVGLAALTRSPQVAFAIGLCFGLVRGSAVLLSARCRTAGQLQQLHRRLAGLEPWSRRVLVAAQAAVALVLAGWSAALASGRLALLVVAVALGLVVAVRLGASSHASRSAVGMALAIPSTAITSIGSRESRTAGPAAGMSPSTVNESARPSVEIYDHVGAAARPQRHDHNGRITTTA